MAIRQMLSYSNCICLHAGIVHIGKAGKGFGLAVELKVRAPGWPADAISRVVEAADALCPYSNAIRGNVDVKLQPLTESDTG